MAVSSQLLVIESGPCHVNWVTTEVVVKGITTLLLTLLSYTNTLIVDLLSLMHYNSRERRARVDGAVEYEMLPMHFLHHLTLKLNTWCISEEEDVVGVDLPSMYVFRFELDRCTLD